jgi:formylglycine-generating enzyme required for sulfatase activity
MVDLPKDAAGQARDRQGMIGVPGGRFRMGSDRHYPEEAPSRIVAVDGFWIDATPVTNAAFARFVSETGYVTFAELEPDPAAYPGIQPELVHPGSLVFNKAGRPTPLHDVTQWWSFQPGADWRHPLGHRSSLDGLDDHPVVHVVAADAEAYAAWAGKSLPTEAEWEYAARGGLDGAPFAWGEELAPEGRMLANYWQGEFPWQNLELDGFERTSPVGTFPPNGYGLYDMIGNVWEWTSDWYSDRQPAPQRACCIPANPRGGSEAGSVDPHTAHLHIGRRVLKGGSHLCAPNYCQRYRPAARYPQPIDTSTSHVGFRCVIRDLE